MRRDVFGVLQVGAAESNAGFGVSRNESQVRSFAGMKPDAFQRCFPRDRLLFLTHSPSLSAFFSSKRTRLNNSCSLYNPPCARKNSLCGRAGNPVNVSPAGTSPMGALLAA